MTRAGRSVVVFGAGAVGRGFIGEIFSDAGWRVVFVDADAELVAALASGAYPHDTVATAGTVRKYVAGCTAVAAQDQTAVRRAVATADVVFTSVGVRNLPRVAPALAAGIADRGPAGRGPLDVFLAENLHDGAALVRGLLATELASQGAHPEQVLAGVGVVECSIGRMIPVPTGAQRREHKALVAVEPYRELPFDVAACRAEVPDVPELVGDPTLDFEFFTERKLYVHNQGHCATAYLGGQAGHDEIARAIREPRIEEQVSAAMYAPARALARKYARPEADLLAHADDLLERFANTALHDTVERVGRDPERKLQRGERFLGALALCHEWDDPRPLLPGLVLGLDKLAAGSGSRAAAAVLSEVRAISPDLSVELEDRYRALRGGTAQA